MQPKIEYTITAEKIETKKLRENFWNEAINKRKICE